MLQIAGVLQILAQTFSSLDLLNPMF